MKNTALITGASSGIGKEFAKIHASNGNDLVLVARNTKKLEALKSELEKRYKVKAIIISKDLTEYNASLEIYEQVSKENIAIHYLINNAGFGGQGYFHERELSADINMIQLNIIALTSLTRLFLPDMVKRNQGKILNVSSTASLLAGPLQAVYFATKAYVTSFSNALSGELEGTNITVTNLMPGATETEFAKEAGLEKTDLFAMASSANQVAQSGYDAMLAGKMDIIAGVTGTQKLMMRMIPFTPKKMLLKQIKQIQEIKN